MPLKFTDKPKTKEEGYIKPRVKAHRKASQELKDKYGVKDDDREEGRHAKRNTSKPPPRLEFKNGGKVKETGKALVHKGEVVLPVKMVNSIKKLLK